MARPPKSPFNGFNGAVPSNLASWAEQLGEALGRGMARGINLGLAGLNLGQPVSTGKRGRPPKFPLVPVPPERRCKVDGCPREARSKGLCSAHYQAERRRALQKSGAQKSAK